jgi:hypothetical protein
LNALPVWWDYTNLTKEKFERNCVAITCGSAMQDKEEEKKRRERKYTVTNEWWYSTKAGQLL